MVQQQFEISARRLLRIHCGTTVDVLHTGEMELFEGAKSQKVME